MMLYATPSIEAFCSDFSLFLLKLLQKMKLCFFWVIYCATRKRPYTVPSRCRAPATHPARPKQPTLSPFSLQA